MITLKLLVESAGEIVLPVENHVHQRVETFAYSDDIGVGAVALDYIESKAISPAKNLRIVNKTSSVPRNAPHLAEAKSDYDSFYGATYNTHSWDILATNVAIVDEQGLEKPLFWKHLLPEGTVSVQIEEVSRGNRNQVETGYKVDLDSGHLFTNYKNYFNPETGAYRLFYVVSSDALGNTAHRLLEPVPATSEAGWQDLNPDTGEIYSAYPLFTRERGVGSNKFTFNKISQWWVRALGRALIQPKPPMALDSNASWFLRISNGDFWAATGSNADINRYALPEYWRQPFSPNAPYIFGSYEEMEFVNESVLKFPRESTAVEAGRSLTIFIRSYDGELLKVLTTDSSLEGQRFGSQNVYYESDKIVGVDNAGGFVSLGIKLLPSWQYAATYYYKADDYQYTGIDLNPIYNKTVRNRMVVFYCKPNMTNFVTDTSVHHLVVDLDGTIIEASEPALSLKSSGVPNTNTVVGTSYSDFLEDYCVTGDNVVANLLIAEIVVDAQGDSRDSLVYDVRRPGLRPKDDKVVLRHPRLAQSSYLGNEDGAVVPRDNVIVIEPPLTLLEEYGGQLTKEEAEKYLTRHLDISKLPVIRWTWPKSRFTATRTAALTAVITGSWDGPGVYRLYRRVNQNASWSLVDSATQNTLPANRVVSIEDTVESAGVYYYCIRIVKNGIEFPEAYSLAIEV